VYYRCHSSFRIGNPRSLIRPELDRKQLDRKQLDRKQLDRKQLDRKEPVLLRLGKTTTLGVMLDWVGDPYQIGLLAGIIDAARSANANLMCFAGGYLPNDPTKDARHQVFDLISPSSVDGVVVFTTTLMHQVGRSGIEAYCNARFKQLPYCSIGAVLEGAPSVIPNNDRGVRQSLTHLIQAHSHRRIALVRGPEGNDEADQRYRAYVETLKEHGIPYDPHLVAAGDFMEASGRLAVQTFSQVPGLRLGDLDAIVASNDGMAIGVMNALAERGFSIPNSIAVTGFDDIEEARLTASPLTTVRQPLEKIGRQAARSVIQWTQTGTKPDSLEVDTELVIRRSCGCASNATTTPQAAQAVTDLSFEASLIMRRQHILDVLTRTGRGRLGVVGADWQARLVNAFVSDMRGETTSALTNIVEEFANRILAQGADVAVCHDVVDEFRRQITGTLRGDLERRDHAEELFYVAHLALSDTLQRSMVRERFRLGRWVRDISYVCNQLSGTFDRDVLRARAIDKLPRVGLKHFYVVAFSDERGPLGAELLVGANNGREVTAAEAFDAASVLPRSILQEIGEERNLAVLPLAWNHVSLGYIVVELDLRHSFSYDPIAEAISFGLYGARLAGKR
jgi:DNA-binding LacI/PurR family transcriptional regulator